MEFSYHIEGGDFSKAGLASSEVKKILKQLNVSASVIKRVVVALYEAEVNVVAHAYEGDVRVDIAPERVVVVVEDRGPGIPVMDRFQHCLFLDHGHWQEELCFLRQLRDSRKGNLICSAFFQISGICAFAGCLLIDRAFQSRI